MQSTPVVKRVRKVIAAGAVIAAGLAFAGCSSQSASTGGTTFNPNDKSIHATLNWDGWAPDVNQVKNYVAAFNKVYPNIKVNFKVVQYTDYAAALRPALVSGSGPDIFDLQPGVLTQQYAQFGVDRVDGLAAQCGVDRLELRELERVER